MDKKKIFKLLSIIILGIILILGGIMYYNYNVRDSIKIKKSYESLNGTVRESDGKKYNNVKLSSNNSFKYIDAKEANSIIKSGSGIIFLGANWCPWCRNAIEVLDDSAKSMKLDTVYYLDMDKVRNVWEVKNGKLVKTQKEADGYYKLLKLLDSTLEKETYKIQDKDGHEYDTKEKRIYIPFVVVVKDGKIMSTHLGTVELNENQDKYSKLTKKQYNKLFETYNKMISELLYDSSCNKKETCD